MELRPSAACSRREALEANVTRVTGLATKVAAMKAELVAAMSMVASLSTYLSEVQSQLGWKCV